MTKLLLKLPWFASAPLVAVIAAILAGAAYYLTGDYFHEECTNERNLLSGEFEASNCGEGAKVAKRQKEDAAGAGSGGASQPGGAVPGQVLATGPFRDGDPGHTGSGTAEIQRLPDARLNLFLRNFSVTNGPDLFVYLSTGANPGRDLGSGALNLGKLQANNGNQNYAIPAGTDTARYRSVVIWCRQFRVNFAFATLQASASTQPAAASSPVVQAAPASTPVPSPAQPSASSAPAGGPSPTAVQPAATQAPAATSTPVPPAPTAAAGEGPGVLKSGTFRDGDPGHTGSGSARVQRLANASLNLFLSSFSVTNGPDLVVYLSTDPGGDRGSIGSALNLGALKANNGNQNYAIPAGTDIAAYRSVIIWCKSFPTVFAYAPLEQ